MLQSFVIWVSTTSIGCSIYIDTLILNFSLVFSVIKYIRIFAFQWVYKYTVSYFITCIYKFHIFVKLRSHKKHGYFYKVSKTHRPKRLGCIYVFMYSIFMNAMSTPTVFRRYVRMCMHWKKLILIFFVAIFTNFLEGLEK